MGNIFNYDGALIQSVNKMVDCILLNLLWILFSIPLFTIGASTTAFYYAVNKVVRNNRGYVWKEFLSSFQSNFKQSTGVWLILLIIYGVGMMDCYVAYQFMQMGDVPQWIFVLIIVVLVLVTVWANYLFPYIARFSNTTKAIMKNAGYMMTVNIGWSLLLLILLLVTVVLCLLVPLFVSFVPVIYMVFASKILERVFRKYMTPEDLEAERERNGR